MNSINKETKAVSNYRLNALICAGTSCVSGEAFAFKDALEKELKEKKLTEEVQVVATGCNGFCAKGPIMVIYPEGIFYERLEVSDVPKLVEEHFIKGRIYMDKTFEEPESQGQMPKMNDIPFFGKQVLIALKNRGLIDPESIDEYISRDGYMGMGKALLELTPEEIIAEVKTSGLRGRGGGGFPTGLKWQFCNQAQGDEKFILCNADEGDPGAFMDRSILESDPHAVLEGMVIGAKAIGAHYGYVYCRAEYPLAIERLSLAISQAREYGLLGDDILGSGFACDLDIYMGAGAFVCGEETALMTSIEGKRGMPRPRPPFPAHKGLWQKPTVLNNVESYANIGQIILRGGDWYASLGTEKSKGTKVFALTGAVNNIGLVEVPMGTSISEIVYDIGGGIKDGKKLKGVQLGGPSGGCVPARLVDTPVDYESITATGAIMGSGGMVVMDETNCMVDIAKFFLEFTAEESCGKCIPCRIGTKLMLDILERISRGEGRHEDIKTLEEMSEDIKEASLCGLGQTAPNPVLTTLKYYRHEYEEHIYKKRCPSTQCKKIISSPCQYTCPVSLDVPSYVTLIAKGKHEEALGLIREKNPLPGICGRVCDHTCEGKCRRGELDESISIMWMKRFAADYEFNNKLKPHIECKPKNGNKVAIIGAGPAGLTAAYFLAREGYSPVIYEKLPVAGGMMSVGIPEYRLPRDIIQYEIDIIKSLGVEIKLNTPMDHNLTVQSLLEQGYKGVFVAIGAHKGLRLGLEGEDGTEGVLDCVTFLRKINLGEKVDLKKRVGVIGAGNAAIDCVRVARRLGCEDVNLIYRRSRKEMPALKHEVDAADEEGVNIRILTNPTKLYIENGKLTGMQCIQMELGEPDASGRRRPVPKEGSEFDLELDTLIPAISQQPDLSCLSEEHGFEISRWNSFEVNEDSLMTNIPGVFAGGDDVTGPATLVKAMEAGQIVAQTMDRYIRGETPLRVYDVVRPLRREEPIKVTDADAELVRPKMPEMDVKERIGCFKEVELGYDEKTSMNEGRRCLRCDLEGGE